MAFEVLTLKELYERYRKALEIETMDPLEQLRQQLNNQVQPQPQPEQAPQQEENHAGPDILYWGNGGGGAVNMNGLEYIVRQELDPRRRPHPTLTDLQKWMFDRYSKNWDELALEPVQIRSSGGSMGDFATIAKINFDKNDPMFTTFFVVTTNDRTGWANLWDFELAREPEDFRKQNKKKRVEFKRDLQYGLNELKGNRMIKKAYLQDGRLFVITKFTYAFENKTGKINKKIPLGRWVFNILINGYLGNIGVANLDYAFINGYDTAFHTFSCWGDHSTEVDPFFKEHNYMGIVDFLITFKTLWPQDGVTSTGSWGNRRRKIMPKDKYAVEQLMRYFNFTGKREWIVGKPSDKPEEIADLFREDTEDIDDIFRPVRGKQSRSFIPVSNMEDVPVGTFVRINEDSSRRYQAPNINGLVTRPSELDKRYVFVEFANGYHNHYRPEWLKRLKPGMEKTNE